MIGRQLLALMDQLRKLKLMSSLEEREIPRTCTFWGTDLGANDAVIMKWYCASH